MAIALDNSGQGDSTSQAAGVAFTFPYSITSNTNGILVIFIQDGDNAGSNHQKPSAVSYGGNALTNVASATFLGAQCYMSTWYLLAPPTGSNTVSVTIPSTGSGSGASREIVYCGSYTGVKQSGQPDSAATNSASSGSSFSGTTTTVADNSWVLGLFFSNQSATPTGGTGTTVRQSSGTIGSGTLFGDSNGVVHPAGSYTMNVNGTSGLWDASIISISPTTSIAHSISLTSGSYLLTGESVGFIKALHMAIASGIYALTGFSSTFGRGLKLIISTGYYSVTGSNLLFKLKAWIFKAKHTASWVETAKHTASWLFKNKS